MKMMKRGFFLLLGMVLSSYLPANAQTNSATLSLMHEGPAPTRTLLAAASSHLVLATFLPASKPAERPAAPTALLVASYKSSRSPENLFQIKTVQTPFVSQSSVTLVRVWGGRLQLSGFGSTHRTGAVLNGYPGPGVPRYLGLREPRPEMSYGGSLTFHLGRGATRIALGRNAGSSHGF